MGKRSNAMVFLYEMEDSARYYNLSGFFYMFGNFTDGIVCLNNSYDKQMWNSCYDCKIDLTGKINSVGSKVICYPSSEGKSNLDEINDLLEIMAEKGYYAKDELEVLEKLSKIYVDNNFKVLEYLGRYYTYPKEKESLFNSYYQPYKQILKLIDEYNSNDSVMKFLSYVQGILVMRMSRIADIEGKVRPFKTEKLAEFLGEEFKKYPEFWSSRVLIEQLIECDKSWLMACSIGKYNECIKKAFEIYNSENLPFLSSVYFGIGSFYYKIGNTEEQRKICFSNAVYLNPSYYLARYMLAAELQTGKNFDDAMYHYNIVEKQLEQLKEKSYLAPDGVECLFLTYYSKKNIFRKRKDVDNVRLMEKKKEDLVQIRLEDALFFSSFFDEKADKYLEFTKNILKKIR